MLRKKKDFQMEPLNCFENVEKKHHSKVYGVLLWTLTYISAKNAQTALNLVMLIRQTGC